MLHISAVPRAYRSRRPARGIERRDEPYVGWPLPRSISRRNDSPDCGKHKLRTHVCACIYARAPWNTVSRIRYFTSGTIGRDSLINTELVCAFPCECTLVSFPLPPPTPSPEFEMSKNIRKSRSLNRDLVEELYRPEQFNRMQRESFSSFFFLPPVVVRKSAARIPALGQR